jgi:hypothetical protein
MKQKPKSIFYRNEDEVQRGVEEAQQGAQTIYLRFDIDERGETVGFHLADRSIIPTVSCDHLVAQPHTLVDCLTVCDTGRL